MELATTTGRSRCFIFSGGTSAFVALDEESGLKDLLPELLKTRVYVG